MTDETDPAIQAESGRDSVTGRFLPGTSGNPKGRPRGLDFKRIVYERAAAAGIPIEDAVWLVFQAMLKAASGGDVAAAKLILERICETEPTEVHVTGTMETPGPPMPDPRVIAAQIRAIASVADELDEFASREP